jgi:hypothetical protein
LFLPFFFCQKTFWQSTKHLILINFVSCPQEIKKTKQRENAKKRRNFFERETLGRINNTIKCAAPNWGLVYLLISMK